MTACNKYQFEIAHWSWSPVLLRTFPIEDDDIANAADPTGNGSAADIAGAGDAAGVTGSTDGVAAGSSGDRDGAAEALADEVVAAAEAEAAAAEPLEWVKLETLRCDHFGLACFCKSAGVF